MKKIIFLVLLATVMVVPAWAYVNIGSQVVQIYQNGEWIDTDTIVIDYNAVGEPNHVRALALDIQLKDVNGNSPKILSYSDASGDYWVYPGTIDINEAGEVNDIGTPIADICDLPSDTLPGLDSNGVTIEMGSLYVGETNAPADYNVLIKLVVDDDCNVVVTENVSRGGVVSEGAASKADPCLPSEKSVRIAPKDPAVAADWRSLGKPKCWLRFKNPRQCHGDIDGRGQGKANNIWVYTWDSEVFRASYGLTEAQLGLPNNPSTIVTSGGDTVKLICADLAHDGQGKAGDIRVYTNDSPTFRNYYSLTTTPADCDP
jgi:hypothetical protein